jgi:hypothetical protein
MAGKRHKSPYTTVFSRKFQDYSGAIQSLLHVIANPQGEAIYARTLDCFTLRVRNDGMAGKRNKSPCFLFALLKAA